MSSHQDQLNQLFGSNDGDANTLRKLPGTPFRRKRGRGHHDTSRWSGTGNETATEAAHIQKSLSRTKQLLQHELERVSHVASAIDDDEHLLRQTMEQHKTLNIKGAKQALTSLERAKLYEQRVLMSSIIFFYFVVAYIAYERILYSFGIFFAPWRWIMALKPLTWFTQYIFDGGSLGSADSPIRTEL
jgi:hypothetical protein